MGNEPPDINQWEGMEGGAEDARRRPEDETAERTILGAMLLDENAINDALELLEDSDWSLDSHRKIFHAISELAETGNPVDLVTLSYELNNRKQMSEVGGAAYLASLTEGLPRKLNVAVYCGIVKEKSKLRDLIGICDLAMARAADQSESAASILNDVEEEILEIVGQTQQKGFESILESVKAEGGADEYLQKMFDPVAMTGLSMGYKDLDEMLGGLQRQNLIVIGARPAMGKSALGINIATNVALKDPNKVVAFFSLEMGRKALYKRMLASTAGVNARKAQMGFLSGEEKAKVAAALMNLASTSIFIDDASAITPVQMRAKCRRLKKKHGGLDLVIVDYLQLMHGGKRFESRALEVSHVSRSLKALSKELNVPVVALAQVRRDTERQSNKRPMLSDLRESGDIEADSDVVMFIHREEVYKPDDEEVRGVAEILLAKNREGPVGMRQLAYLADTTRFETLERTAY